MKSEISSNKTQASVNFRKLKSYQASFLTQSYEIKIINYRKKKTEKKKPDIWRLKRILVNNQEIADEIKRGNKKY